MKIDGIEYRVLLIIDRVGAQTASYTFADFYEMNAFIRQHKTLPEYFNCSVCYSLVDVSEDGYCNSRSWDQTIEFEEFSDEKIEEEIRAQEEWVVDVAKWSAEMDERAKTINYDHRPQNPERKRSQFKDFAYVCPFCICEVEECECTHYPYYLMQIDRKILPIIRELNIKGYKTTGCCAGHPDQEELYSTNIYICFDKNYDFDWPFPEGMHYYKLKHCLTVSFPNDCEDLFDFQEKTLWALSDWAEMLSDLNEDDSWLYEE